MNPKSRAAFSIAIPIGGRWELFVDDFLVDRMRNVRFELQRPERREVAFCCDAPWEDNVAFFNSVCEDGGAVRLYYRAACPDHSATPLVFALATSADRGLSFERPNLGLVEFGGSKANNILFAGEPPFFPPPAFLDTNPNCKPDERYKGFSNQWQRLFAMASPDGIHWRPLAPEPIRMSGTFDTVNTAFWDRRSGCYRSFTRYLKNAEPRANPHDFLKAESKVVRAIQTSTSTDFLNWTEPVPLAYNDDYADMQLYTNAIIPCPDAEHIYLGFPNRYVQDRIADATHPESGVNDALFMCSRDAIHWERYAEAWVRPGLDHLNWTERNNYPTWGIVKTAATEWSMYISEHYRHPGHPGRLRRRAIRPHGFVAVRADYRGGELLTKPVVFQGTQLRLNYATSAAGSIRVEIRDADGRPLKEWRPALCRTIFGDQLDAPVGWKDSDTLATLAGKPVRLRFELRDADLFAFRFA